MFAPEFPLLLITPGDPELFYLESHDALTEHIAATGMRHDGAFLVDSGGNIYDLSAGSVELQPVKRVETMPLDELLGYIKAHAALKGSCCVAKLYAPSIRAAFTIVAALEDE